MKERLFATKYIITMYARAMKHLVDCWQLLLLSFSVTA